MLTPTHERFFLHCELNLSPFRKKGVPLKMVDDGNAADVLTILEKAWKDGRAKLQMGPEDWVRITEIKRYPDDGIAVILFRRGDPRAAAQVYEDKEGNLRRSDKTDEDRVAVSCHLFINTTAVAGTRYKAILEEVASLGRSYVQHIISMVLSEHQYTYRDDKGVEKTTRTIAHLDGLKGEKLGESDGTFEYIDLYREGQAPGLDEVGIEPRRQTMRLKIKAGTPDVLDKIKAVKDWAVEREWTEFRVRINLPDGKSRVVPLGREADATDVLFSRSVLVRVSNRMETCTDVVNEELREIAVEHFAEANWV